VVFGLVVFRLTVSRLTVFRLTVCRLTVFRLTVFRLTVFRVVLPGAGTTGTRATAGRVPTPMRDGAAVDAIGNAIGVGVGTARTDDGDAAIGDDRRGAAVGATSSIRLNAAPHESIAQRAMSVATKRSADHCIANDDAIVSHSARSTGDAGSR